MFEKRTDKQQGKRVGYGRCSTHSQTTDVQNAALKAAGCELIFVESVSSRAPIEKRKMLQQALEALNSGDELVVAKLDRLGRSQVEVVTRLNELNEKGIHLKTLDGLIDTRALGLMAPLFIGLLSGLAEVERNLISERTKESIEHRRRTGGNIGGRPPIANEKADAALKLRAQGMTFRAIGEVLNIAPSTICRLTQSKDVA
ncbi:recombinase family protein [bacterium]|nr:recombinase family protein [bacterium]